MQRLEERKRRPIRPVGPTIAQPQSRADGQLEQVEEQHAGPPRAAIRERRAAPDGRTGPARSRRRPTRTAGRRLRVSHTSRPRANGRTSSSIVKASGGPSGYQCTVTMSNWSPTDCMAAREPAVAERVMADLRTEDARGGVRVANRQRGGRRRAADRRRDRRREGSSRGSVRSRRPRARCRPCSARRWRERSRTSRGRRAADRKSRGRRWPTPGYSRATRKSSGACGAPGRATRRSPPVETALACRLDDIPSERDAQDTAAKLGELVEHRRGRPRSSSGCVFMPKRRSWASTGSIAAIVTAMTSRTIGAQAGGAQVEMITRARLAAVVAVAACSPAPRASRGPGGAPFRCRSATSISTTRRSTSRSIPAGASASRKA